MIFTKNCDGKLATTDYNLTKVAQVREVDVVNIMHGEMDVGQVSEDTSHRVGDPLQFNLRRGHLVEQCVEGMLAVAVHQQYVKGQDGQGLRSPQSAKASRHDHYTRGSAFRHHRAILTCA